jgi:hypothetical protein
MMTESRFKEIYHRYKATGLTVKAFCINEGIVESGFYYWQRRLRQYLPETKGFVPIVIGQGKSPNHLSAINETKDEFSAASRAMKDLMCEINYPNGIRMKLQGSMDSEMLRSLLLL